MASNSDFVQYIVEQMKNAGEITYKKMFGEYGIYCNGKIVALVCDNQLFVKPTSIGKEFIKNPIEAPPYPGAKSYFLIQDKLENKEWLGNLIRLSEEELPKPKKKKK